MAVVIDGTTGITTPALDSEGNLEYSGTLTGGTGVVNIGSGQVYKDASGNVGVGTSSPGHRLELVKSDPASLGAIARFYHGPASNRSIEFGASSISPFPLYIQGRESGSATNDMTLQPEGGNLLVGTTSQVTVNGAIRSVSKAGTYGMVIHDVGNNTAMMAFIGSNNVQVGSIISSTTATAYNTSSDYRLKEDAQPVLNPINRLMQLKPINFAWKVDGSRVDGFLAHEAQAVVPEAVTGTKDAMRDEEYEKTPAVTDDDGNVVTPAVMDTRSVPDYQGIDQSKLVPLLTAALQEQQTIITDLKARIEQLESK